MPGNIMATTDTEMPADPHPCPGDSNVQETQVTVAILSKNLGKPVAEILAELRRRACDK